MYNLIAKESIQECRSNAFSAKMKRVYLTPSHIEKALSAVCCTTVRFTDQRHSKVTTPILNSSVSSQENIDPPLKVEYALNGRKFRQSTCEKRKSSDENQNKLSIHNPVAKNCGRRKEWIALLKYEAPRIEIMLPENLKVLKDTFEKSQYSIFCSECSIYFL